MFEYPFNGALLGSTAALAVLATGMGPKDAYAVPTPTLHGFCYGSSACADTSTPAIDAANQHTYTLNNPTSFGFYASGGPTTGDFRVDILVPDIAAAPAGFVISGTQGGVSNNLTIGPVTASLVSATPWSSGSLADYLGNNAKPANPIGAYTSAMAGLSVSATSFWVYSADLGTSTLQSGPNDLKGPLLSVGKLPIGSYIAGFLDPTGSVQWSGTANSGAILEETAPIIFSASSSSSIPEPTSLLVMATGVLGLGAIRRWRR